MTLLRATLLLVACAAGEVFAWRLAAAAADPAAAVLTAPTIAGVAPAADLVSAAAAIVLALGWTWLSCGAALTVGDHLRGRTTVRRLAVPHRWHRLVAGLLGAGALCLPPAASALAPDDDGYRGSGRPAVTLLEGLPLPDRPHGVGNRAPRPGHVVAEGDSLWSLTREHLPVGASDARIAVTWPRWYAANREVIGADPNLLIPGTVLQAPEAHPDTSAGSDPARDDGGDHP